MCKKAKKYIYKEMIGIQFKTTSLSILGGKKSAVWSRFPISIEPKFEVSSTTRESALRWVLTRLLKLSVDIWPRKMITRIGAKVFSILKVKRGDDDKYFSHRMLFFCQLGTASLLKLQDIISIRIQHCKKLNKLFRWLFLLFD